MVKDLFFMTVYFPLIFFIFFSQINASESLADQKSVCDILSDIGCRHLIHKGLTRDEANKILKGPTVQSVMDLKGLGVQEANDLIRGKYSKPIGSFLIRETDGGGAEVVFLGIKHSLLPDAPFSLRGIGKDVGVYSSRDVSEKYLYGRNSKYGEFILRLSGSKNAIAVSQVDIFYLPIVKVGGVYSSLMLKWGTATQLARNSLGVLRLQDTIVDCANSNFIKCHQYFFREGVVNRYNRSKIILYILSKFNNPDVTRLISSFLFQDLS